MKKLLLFVFLLFSLSSAAQGIFVKAFDDLADKADTFKPGGEWFPYPDYHDRAAWDELSKPFAEKILANAEKYLNYEWKLYRASDYLKYEKTHDRKIALPEEENRMAIIGLTLGELVEGKGRFMKDLVDGLWFLSSQYAWGHYEHTGYQPSRRTLPSPEHYLISLHDANTASCIAVAWHFFREDFDKMDPSIARTISASMETHLFTPFFSEYNDSTSHKIWTGFKRSPGKKLNNWAPYCAHHVLVSFLLMEKDPQRLQKAVRRCAEIMDMYLADQSPDGACDEGPGYWNMSFGKVYDYARTLADASCGKCNIFGTELIRRMGEYKSKTFLSGSWVYSFGDCSTRDIGSPALLFRFGKDTGSKELMDFALYLLRDTKTKKFKVPSLNYGQLDGTMRQLETLRYQKAMKEYEDAYLASTKGFGALRSGVTSEYYPVLGYAIIRKNKWELACKGAHNGESHNHNDVGSGMVMFDTMPIILDAGVGAYTKDTFGENRYTVWTMRSDWHSTPSPNGVLQMNGRDFASKNTSCDLDRGLFSTDVSGAYPKEAECRKWVRNYELSETGLTIRDEFELSKRTGADIINFPIRGEVALPGESIGEVKAGPSEVLIKIRTFEGGRDDIVRITWSKGLTPAKEVIEITDKKIKTGTGPTFTKLYFTSSKKASLKGIYTFNISEK